MLTGAQAVVERQRDDGGGRRRKLHVARALERRGVLKSGVERCSEGRGWCSPFIGAGEVVIRGVMVDVNGLCH
jgi:hypothetical protein